jgi:microcystin-dependent protein
MKRISLLLSLSLLISVSANANEFRTFGGIGTESLYLIDITGKTLQLKPGSLSSSFSLTLPIADGTSSQYLKTNGSGTLSWGTPGGMPAGTIIAFAGSSCPAGYTAADGSAKSRTVTYDILFAAIGTTWGAGDGSTTFNVPDLRGRFMRGTGTNGDGNGGDAITLGTYQADEFKSHSHNLGVSSSTSNVAGGGLNVVSGPNTTSPVISGGANSTGGTESRPKSYGVLYCISI